MNELKTRFEKLMLISLRATSRSGRSLKRRSVAQAEHDNLTRAAMVLTCLNASEWH